MKLTLLALLVALAATASVIDAGDAGEASGATCTGALVGNKVTWLAKYHDDVMAGTAAYFPNGTLVTWDEEGEIVNSGQYTIHSGPDGQCYEYEVYDYPPGAGDTCNTFRVIPATRSFIGCEVFGPHRSKTLQCLPECNSPSDWANWYSAVVIGSA